MQDIPHWRAQPYVRPPPSLPSIKKAAALSTTPSAVFTPRILNHESSTGTIVDPTIDHSSLDRKRSNHAVVSDEDESSKRLKRSPGQPAYFD